jgi:hypothetical protein
MATAIGTNSWQNRVHQELGANLQPQEGETWEQLHQRLYQKIFSSANPLHEAASLGCERVILQLAPRENVNAIAYRMTPLCCAAAATHIEAVKMLLRFQADPQPKKGVSLKPLDYVLDPKEGNYEIAELLLHRITELDGEVMCGAAFKENRALLLLFLQRGFSINLRDRQRHTALNFLCRSSTVINSTMVQWLIDHGADVNIPDEDGLTPLHYAIEKRDFRVIDLLLQRGANIFAVDKYGDGCIAWGLFGTSPQSVVGIQNEYYKIRLVSLGATAGSYAFIAYHYLSVARQKCLAATRILNVYYKIGLVSLDSTVASYANKANHYLSEAQQKSARIFSTFWKTV